MQVTAALPRVAEGTLSKAYVGFLGFYNSQGSLKWSNAELVQTANEFMGHLGASCQCMCNTMRLGCVHLCAEPVRSVYSTRWSSVLARTAELLSTRQASIQQVL